MERLAITGRMSGTLRFAYFFRVAVTHRLAISCRVSDAYRLASRLRVSVVLRLAQEIGLSLWRWLFSLALSRHQRDLSAAKRPTLSSSSGRRAKTPLPEWRRCRT